MCPSFRKWLPGILSRTPSKDNGNQTQTWCLEYQYSNSDPIPIDGTGPAKRPLSPPMRKEATSTRGRTDWFVSKVMSTPRPPMVQVPQNSGLDSSGFRAKAKVGKDGRRVVFYNEKMSLSWSIIFTDATSWPWMIRGTWLPSFPLFKISLLLPSTTPVTKGEDGWTGNKACFVSAMRISSLSMMPKSMYHGRYDLDCWGFLHVFFKFESNKWESVMNKTGLSWQRECRRYLFISIIR